MGEERERETLCYSFLRERKVDCAGVREGEASWELRDVVA